MSPRRMPDGVAPPHVIANHVMAIIRGSRARQVAVRPLPSNEDAYRKTLLERARKGEKKAIKELWQTYRMRLVSVEQDLSTQTYPSLFVRPAARRGRPPGRGNGSSAAPAPPASIPQLEDVPAYDETT
jgi:hypothetical protein